jgi:aspartate racemase
MKKAWIIWGLWPDTTSKFYLELWKLFNKNNSKTRPDLLFYNIPIQYELEYECIVEEKWIQKMADLLVNCAKSLENAWADFIVIPCNSVHENTNITKLRKNLKIPVISIIDETIKFIEKEKLNNIWLISTWISAKRKLYSSRFNKEKYNFFEPQKREQREINNIIYNLVNWVSSDKGIKKLKQIILNLQNKWAKCIFLACTDLQLIYESSIWNIVEKWIFWKIYHKFVPENKENIDIPIYDTMHILVEATFAEMIK